MYYNGKVGKMEIDLNLDFLTNKSTEEVSIEDHRLNLSLRYTFNAQKSKYKGTGAGKDAAGRMKK